jgi:LCP family protein required for cell wall assembly
VQGSPYPRRPPSRGDHPGRVYGGGTGGYGARSEGGYGGRATTPVPGDPRERQPARDRTARDRQAGRERPAGRDRLTRARDRRAQRERSADPDYPDPAPGAGDPPGRSRRRTPVWAALTLSVGVLLMLLSGTALAGYEVLNNRYAGNVQQENLLGDAAAEPGKELDGPLNLLLLGVEEQGEGARSDTIIVLHIPSSHDQAYLISMPRDTWVSVPGYWDMKITEAFNAGYENGGGWAGGAQLIASVLHDLTGLQFDGAAMVNFDGFRKIIDELGGIEFCIDTAATSEHLVLVDGEPMRLTQARREGHWDAQQIHYEEGCQRLEGWQALDYVRQRKTLASGEGDYGRQRHQQQLIRAMADATVSRDVLTNINKLDSLILAAGDALIVDTNTVPLADFVFTLRDVGVGDLVLLRTNGGEYHSTQINGKSVELLSDESLAMFEAAANDTMAQFVLNHPHFVNPDNKN